MNLKFLIQGQKLQMFAPQTMVADAVNYFSAEFMFRDEDWYNLNKYAHFQYGEACYDIPLENNEIAAEVGLNLMAGKWTVHVHGDRYENGELRKRITTNLCSFDVSESGCLEGDAFPSVPPDLATQLIAELEALKVNGGTGAPGQDGKSAYELALSNGFVGSESEWLASLIGPQGPKGEKGATGATGPQGPAGADGKSYSVDVTKYPIPVLYLTGTTAGMSKENSVSLHWEYGENSGSCTLKWQGSSSLSYPKKNYTIKLDTGIDVGFGVQKKYCLKANYIDFSHSRNIVSARLWAKMVESRKTVNPLLKASPNYGAVDGFPIAVILNGEYHGLYTWNIPKDGWMMNMGNGTQECILCSDHSTAAQFKGEALCDESDFEIEYISDENNTAWAVTSVNRLITACMNSNGSDLDSKLAQYIDWESAIDYYILVALLDGQDMTDKNYLLATYDGVKWFFSAYDMDSTYGLKWNASGFSKANYGDHTSFTNYANKHRVMELIKRFKTDELKARYKELREDILSADNIAREFERFACQLPAEVLHEDARVWPSLPCTVSNSIWQILLWLNRRLVHLDHWLDDLPEQEVPENAFGSNLVHASTDESGNVFNGTGYMNGYRLSTTSGGISAQEGATVTGFIPWTLKDGLVQIKGIKFGSSASVDLADGYVNTGIRCNLTMYDVNKTYLNTYISYDNWKDVHKNGNTSHWSYGAIQYDELTETVTLDISKHSEASKCAFIRINGAGDGENMVVTVIS